MKSILILLATALTLSAQGVLPVTVEIMENLQRSYENGEVQSYIDQVIQNQKLSEEDSIEVDDQIRAFFESDQFIQTGAQYLSSLFTERELEEMKVVLEDSSLRSDPNFGGAAKLDKLMNRLKPYIVKYLRNITRK